MRSQVQNQTMAFVFKKEEVKKEKERVKASSFHMMTVGSVFHFALWLILHVEWLHEYSKQVLSSCLFI